MQGDIAGIVAVCLTTSKIEAAAPTTGRLRDEVLYRTYCVYISASGSQLKSLLHHGQASCTCCAFRCLCLGRRRCRDEGKGGKAPAERVEELRRVAL